MAGKTTQQEIMIKGILKMPVALKISRNNDEYYSVPLKIIEKNGQEFDSDSEESIFLIFWKKDFELQTQKVIGNLKENQTVTVYGQLGGRDNGLLRVTRLDDDSDLFI